MTTGPPRRPLRSICVLVIVALLAAVLQVLPATSASALATATVFNEPFHNNSLSKPGSLMLPTSPSGNGANNACLTVTGSGAVPGSCAAPNDTSGSGVLRLTTTGTYQDGGVFSTASIPSTQLIDATFNTYQYGTPGDGLAFGLAAADPSNPQPPTTLGQQTGALGYSNNGASSAGLINGYLGFGFDVWGGYSATSHQGAGCATLPYISTGAGVPGQVVVRGPGSVVTGYCAINSTATGTTSQAVVALHGTTRANSRVPVEVVINPLASSMTTTSGLTVAALSYLVAFTPVGGSQRTLTGSLPSGSGILPASYLGANGIPKNLTFGWTGATGGSAADYHEIDGAQVATYSTIPVLGVTQTAYYDSAVVAGDPVTYRVVPSVSSGGPDEGSTITLSETLPANLTPMGGYGTGWSCTVSGQVVTCTNPNGPFTAGASLSPVNVLGIAQASLSAATVRSSVAAVSAADATSASTSASAAGGEGAQPAGIVLSPATGPAQGGTAVAVTGTTLGAVTAIVPITTTDFTNNIRTTLFPCQGAATSGCFTINSGTSITIPSMPAHAVGAVPIKVIGLGNFATTTNYTYTSPSPPNAPASVAATAGNLNAAVSWTAPSNTNGSAVTSYTVTPYQAGVAQTAIVTGTTALSTTVTGLTAGLSYTFAVAATNTCTGAGSACGTGPTITSNAVVPNALPAAPTSVAATTGSLQATVTWTAPAANGGTAITSYLITPYIGTTAQTAQAAAAGATSQVVTGLTAGSVYTFKVAAVNAAGTGASSAGTNAVTINAGPTLSFAAPAAGEVAVPYTTPLTVTGGTTPYTWSLAGGTLPAGLSLTASTGVLSGTPTASGSFPFTVQVVDSGGGTATKAVTLVIAAAPVVVFAPAAGEISVPYSQQATTSGGTAPYGAWSITAGSLPAGVALNTATGVVSGTPTTSGTFSVALSITDAFGKVANNTASIVIAALPTLTFAAPAAGQAGVPYSTSLTTTGGSAPLAWSISAGSVPAGLTLNTATGVLSGTPTTAASYSFTVAVVDANGKTDSKATTLVIAAGPIVIVKTANVTSTAPGGVVQYTITVTNTASTPVTGVNLSDPLTGVLDDSVYNANAATTAGTLTYTASTLGWTGDLAANAAVTITYSVTVTDPDTGNRILNNTVTSTTLGTDCAGDTLDTRCTATVTVSGLTIAKTASVANTTPGSVVTFTIQVTNTGQTAYAAQSATFTESLAGILDDATYNTAAATVGTVSYTNPTISWNGNLAVGASATITYSVTIADPDTGNKSLTGTVVSSAAGSTCPSGAPAAGCTATVTVLVPALMITNTAGGSTPVTPGAVVPYTVTVANTGQTAYTAISVALALAGVLDDGTYNNNGAASAGAVAYNAGNLVWTGDLAVGATVTVTASITVTNPDPGDKTLTTVASSGAAGSTCPAGSSNSACTSTASVKVPALTITKAANVSTTTPGSVVQYTVTVTNTGQTDYTGASVADGLTGVLDDAAYTSASATAGAVSFTSPTLTWTGNLLIGATATITYSVTVNNPDSGNKSLAATITSTTAGNNCVPGSSDTRCTSTVTVLIPSLTVSAAVDSATTTPGSVVVYTVTVTNSGPTTYTATPVTFGFSGVTDDATYNNSGTTTVGSLAVGANSAVWTLTLSPGATATATLPFTVKNPDTRDKAMPTVTSSDAAGSTCPTGSANTACNTSTTVLIPGLTIVKTANLATVVTGGTVVYTVVVTNSGQSTYAAANFTDSLATVLTDATYAGGATATSGTISYAAPVLSWTGALAVGASATISYSVTILDPDPGDKRITNTVVSTAAGSNCASGSTDTRCTAAVNIVVPGLTIVKAANASTTTPGAVVGYTVTVTNSGQTAYTGAAFTDSLTAVLDDATYNADVAATSGTASYAGSTISWTGDLAVGAVATITYTVTVHTADGGNNLVTDTAVSATKGNNCASGSVDARCTVTVPVARLVISAVAAEPTTTPGSVVHLTTTITNTGRVPYTGISITGTGEDLSDDVVLNGDQRTSSGTVTVSPTNSTWTGNVPVGAVVTLTLTVTVLNPDTGNKIINSTWTSTAPGNNCAAGSGDSRCTIFSRVLVPGLTISTTANRPSAAPGDTIGYTVTLFNSGQTAYTATTVVDSLTSVQDDAIYNADASATAGAVSFSSPTITWTGDLAVGATVTITFTVTVRSPDPGDKIMSNVVTSAAVGNTCPAASGSTACTATVAVLTPGLTIVKTANLTTATLGSAVAYTVVVTNTGQTPYTAAAFTDSLSAVQDDAGYGSDATATTGAVSYTSPTLSWTGALAVGASATITYSVTVNSPASGDRSMSNTIVSNTAGNNCASGAADTRCTAVVAITNSVSLTFTRTAGVATTVAGATVSYTVTAANASTSAVAANFTDPLAGILDDATYNGNAAASSGTLTYTAPDLVWSGTVPAGATVTVTYTVTVGAAITGNEILSGKITSTLPAASNNCLAASVDTRCATTVPIAALLIQNLNSGTTTPGAVVATRATFTNTGQVPYVGISIANSGPDLLDDVTAVGDQQATSGSISVSPSALVWTGDIPVGGVVTLTSTLTVNNPDAGNKLIMSTSTSTAPGNNCQSGSTDPRCTLSIAVLIPGLTFTSTASVPSVAPGGTVTFTIAVKNTGQTAYTGAAFTDSLTGILDDAGDNNDAAATVGTVSYTASTLGWSGDLAVGATATITFTATAKEPDPGDKGMSHTLSSSTVGSNCLPASGAAGCSASVVVLTPGLAMVKTASPTAATLGSTVTYTVVVSNTGQTSYPAATFSDNLAGLLDDSVYNSGASTASTGTLAFSSPTLTWTGALAPGAAATITYTVTVNNPDNGDRSMADTLVSTSTGSNCLAGSQDTRCASLVTITNQPSLRFTKTSDVATSVGGGIVHYTIVVLNSSAGAVAANFTDPLAGIIDDATDNGDAAAGGGTITSTGPDLTWSGTVPAGATVTVTYSVTVHAAVTGDQILSGTLRSTSLPGSNNCAAGSLDIRCSSTVPIARLDLVQTATETSASPGSVVHITAGYTNTGKVGYSGISVSSPRADTSDDTIPTGDHVATSGTLVRTPTNLTWNGDIPVGGTVTVTRTLTVQNPDPGNQRITATLNSTAVGNNCPSGTTDPRCTFLIAVVTPGLTITTTAGTASTMPGSTVGYTVTVRNTGQTAYTGASFTDPLSGMLNDATYNTNATATSGTVSYTAPTLTWTGDLAVGATATITFSMTVNNPDTGDKTMVNTVSSNTVGSTCPPASSNTACRSTVLVLTPALTIVKTASLPTVTLGSIVTYTIVVTNSGQTAYSAANFSDSLSAVLDDATYNADAAATSGTIGYSGGVLTWSGALAVGAAATVTYSVTVANPATGDKSMSNTVTSTTTGSDCASGSTDTRCTAVVAVVNAVTLSFVNTANVLSTVAGAVVQYTVTVTNSSGSAIVGANFTDPLGAITDDAAYNANAAATSGSVSYTSPNLTWTGDVPAGGTVTVTYSVTVNAAVTGDQILTGTLTSTSSPASDNCISGHTEPRCTSTVPVAALLIQQSYTETTTTPGSIVHLTATFTNTGQFPYAGISVSSPSADTVDDALPNGDQSATSGSLVLTAAGIIWTGTIPVGGVVTVVGTLTIENPDPGNKILTGTLVSAAPGNNCPSGGTDPRCTATSTVQLPGLTVTKSVSATTTTPGSSVNYTISVQNTGQTAYSAATVTDSLTGVLDDASYDTGAAATAGTLTYSSPILTWTGPLAVGASVTVTYSVTVFNPDPGDKSLVDSAVSSNVGSTCPAATGTAACRSSVDVLTPGLTIVKTASLAAVTLGASVTYTISVTNTGQTPYVGATFADSLAGVLDDATYNADANSTTGTLAYTSPVLTWTGDLAVGAAAVITYSATVILPSVGDRSMVNTVTSTTTGNNCAVGNTDTRCGVTVAVNNSQTLRFIKTADVSTTVAGAVVHYTVTATNNSAAALTSVSFTDGLAGVLDDADFNSPALASSGAVVFSNPNLTWTGPIAAGATVTVTYSVTVHATITGNELLTGTVTSAAIPASDNCLVGSVDALCTTTVPIAALVILQTFSTPTTTPGSVIGIGATFTNTGQVPYVGITIAGAVVVDDLSDDSAANGDQTASSGALSLGPRGPSWTGDIPVGATVTIGGTLTVKDPDTGNRVLKTTLASTAVGNNCPQGSTDTRCTAITTVLLPGLSIVNSADTSAVVPGGTAHFTITVTNSGQTAYTGASFTDPLAGLLDDATYNTDAAATSGTASFASGTLSWTGDLAVGTVAVITFSVTARNPDPGDKAMSQTVVSTTAGSTCLPASGVAACSATVVVLTPALTIVKTANVTTATLGTTVTYTVVVSNTGQTPYTPATFSDSLTGVLDDATYNAVATTASVGTAAYGASVLSWSGPLNPGDVATISYTVTINSPSSGDLTMSNTVVSTTTGSNCGTGSLDVRCTSVVSIANSLSVTFTQTADVASSVAGGVVNYTVNVVNASTLPMASNFTDPLTGVLDDAAYSGGAVATAGTVTYSAPNLSWSGTVPALSTVTVTYAVTVNAVGTGDENLTDTLTSTAPTTSNNCLAGDADVRCTIAVPLARLTLAYSGLIAPTVTPGGIVHYVSTYTNTGKVPYFGISVATLAADAADDQLPGTQTVTSGTLVLDATGITWTGDIPVGGTVTMDALIPVKNPDTGDKFIQTTMVSTATGNNCFSGSADPRCINIVTVTVPGLTITQSANVTSVTPGGIVQYTVVLTNSGQTPYAGAVVTDSLAGVLDDAAYNGDATATSGAVTFTSPTLTWTGDLAVGTSATITYTATAARPDPGDKVMANTVTSSAVGSSCLPDAGSAGCSTTVAVLTPGLTLLSTASTSSSVPGAVVTYTVTATNTGQMAYNAAAFSAPLAGILDDAAYNGDAAAGGSGTLTYTGGVLGWSGPLPLAASVTVTFSVTVGNPDAGDHRLGQTLTSTNQGANCPTVAGSDPRCSTSVPVASLRLVSAADVSTTKPTGVVHYTNTFTNTGQVPYVGVTALINVSGASDDAVYNGDGTATTGSVNIVVGSPTLSWTGDLPVGATVVFTASVTVKNPDLGDKLITTAMTTTTPGSNCPVGGGDPVCATLVTVQTPGLTISKTADVSTTTPGSTVNYTMTIANTGQTAYTAATVTDALASVLNDATYSGGATATLGAVSFVSPVLTWTGDLAVGQSAVITFSVVVDNPDLGDKTMADRVVSDELGSTCPTGGTAPACATSVTVLVPALAISLTADSTTATPGAIVSYTLTVGNVGQTPYNAATVTTSLAGVLDDSGAPGGVTATLGTATFSTPNLTWTGDLAVGATAVITYDVTVADPDVGDQVLTTSVASAAAGGTCTAAAPCVHTVTVLTPGLAVSTTSNVATATPGDQVIYTVTIANTGQTAYVGTTVTVGLADVVDDATFDGTITASIGTAGYTAPTVTWTGSLPIGTTAVITYSVTVRSPDPGNKLMPATVVADGARSTCATGSSNPACTASVTVLVPSLTIAASADQSSVVPGTVVNYTILITNTGQTTYTGATVTDVLTGVLDDATYGGDAAIIGGGALVYVAPTLTWTGDLVVGASATITYSATVRNPDPGDKSMAQTLTSTAPGSSCPVGGDFAACTTSVQVVVPKLTVTQTADRATVVAGSAVRYTVTIVNSGQTNHAPATLSDSLSGILDDATYNGDAAATVGTVSYAGNTVSWSGPLAIGATATITFSVTTNIPTTGNRVLSNTTLSPTQGSNCISGTAARCNTAVAVLVPALTVTQTASTNQVVAGGVISYTIVAVNSGQADYPAATITDSLAGLLANSSYNGDATSTAGAVSYSGGTLSWAGPIPIGVTLTIMYSVTTNMAAATDVTLVNAVVSPSAGSTCTSAAATVPPCAATTTVAARTIGMSDLSSGFTLTGLPHATVTADGAITMTITTNSPAGYTVTVQASSDVLSSSSGGNTVTIPLSALLVRESGTTAWLPVTSLLPVLVHQQNTPSAPSGDAVSNDYQMLIPFVPDDTYTTTLDYIASAQ